MQANLISRVSELYWVGSTDLRTQLLHMLAEALQNQSEWISVNVAVAMAADTQ